MPSIETQKLLEVWETMWNRTPCEQAVGLVAATFPELSPSEVVALPIGRRDALLLRLRALLFGTRADMLARCPDCQEQCELTINVLDLELEPTPLAPFSVAFKDREYLFRLPNSSDILRLSQHDTASPQCALIAGCYMSGAADQEDEILSDKAFLNAVMEEMEEQDPQANIEFSLNCAHCHHCWDLPFDITSYLWSELNSWARRLLGEIHTLASTYGWSEGAILSMSTTRRQIYLNLATG